ncbi:MAG: glutamate synthase [Clostridia bacterium]|nr:glutamate synthase [Clostridia bacterium]
MTNINAADMDHRAINEAIRGTDSCRVTGCLGQRFIASGMKDKRIEITGTPGNALGAYLAGADITVAGNVQDAVGDTMNGGSITVSGSAGDALGYAMRGGRIFIRGSAGYRAGIHMKAYGDQQPVIIIGGRAGSFLGEYQAGGTIAVLGLHEDGHPLLGNFPCTGMHGGKLYLRGDVGNVAFPPNVTARPATQEDMAELLPHLQAWCDAFGVSMDRITDKPFTVVVPDSANPYKQMYVAN